MEKQSKLTIFCDGGSRGNPGKAAYGFVVYDYNQEVVYKEGKTLGVQTNNFAEYSAVVHALKWILKNPQIQPQSIQFFLDSKLVVEQLSGEWKVKSESLRSLFHTAKTLERTLNMPIAYVHVPREKNTAADAMVNLALDN